MRASLFPGLKRAVRVASGSAAKALSVGAKMVVKVSASLRVLVHCGESVHRLVRLVKGAYCLTKCQSLTPGAGVGGNGLGGVGWGCGGVGSGLGHCTQWRQHLLSSQPQRASPQQMLPQLAQLGYG